MPAHHKILLAALRKNRRIRKHSQANDSYLSSGHHYYDISIPTLRALAKTWLKENKGIPHEQFLALLNCLYRGRSYEEKVLASILLSYHRAGRRTIGLRQLDAWLDRLVGWAEIDSLCQNAFTADEMVADWRGWERFIRNLSRHQNINKRRAALVFLTTPVCDSDDERLASLAFQAVETLKSEREIIITKALSWLLRSLVKHHKPKVASYIKESRGSLPAIAVRETTRKIQTGRK